MTSAGCATIGSESMAGKPKDGDGDRDRPGRAEGRFEPRRQRVLPRLLSARQHAVPLLEEGGIDAFIRREVLPYAPDA